MRPIVVLVALLLPATAHAQLAAPVMPAWREPAAAAAALRPMPALRAGQRVRVALGGEGRVEGRVVRSDADGLELATADGTRRITALPDSVWTRGRRTTTGLLVGSLVGLASGLVIRQIVDYDGNGGPALVVLPTLSGAALGALVGTALPRWVRRYP